MAWRRPCRCELWSCCACGGDPQQTREGNMRGGDGAGGRCSSFAGLAGTTGAGFTAVAVHWANRGCASAPQERIVPVDVLFPQVVGQLFVVTKISSQDRILQSTREQILDVSVPQMIEQLGEVPEISSKDQILWRTRERVLEVPVPQFMEQLVGVPKIVFSRQNPAADFRAVR